MLDPMTTSAPERDTVDGNEAAADVAFRCSDVIAIYPITPASPIAESCDSWAASGRVNLWGTVPEVVEMQSEAGAAGTLHGAATRGALATTFTASQGLLLMLPNMFKLAGELTPSVIHVAARSIATHALSIFGDHSDVMAARTTGFAMLSSGSVQEAADFAAVAHAATLESRVPFLHFFDGFRTSHEVNTIEPITDADLRALIDDERVADQRRRALDPDHPVLRGTAQNPDVFFQAREAANPVYAAVPAVVQATFDRLAERTGRRYGLVEYDGAPDADRVVVLMGSSAGAALETVEALCEQGERVGVVRVRLFRPLPVEALLALVEEGRQVIRRQPVDQAGDRRLGDHPPAALAGLVGDLPQQYRLAGPAGTGEQRCATWRADSLVERSSYIADQLTATNQQRRGNTERRSERIHTSLHFL
jgi:pyruvate-ferredoxin/flavodoxin oxidoreductase